MAHRKLHPRVPGFGCCGLRIMTTGKAKRIGQGNGGYSSTNQKQTADFMEQMQHLGDLKDKGYLNDDEFAAAKSRIFTVDVTPDSSIH